MLVAASRARTALSRPRGSRSAGSRSPRAAGPVGDRARGGGARRLDGDDVVAAAAAALSKNPAPRVFSSPWRSRRTRSALWHEYRRTRDQALRDRLILTYAPLVKYVAGRLGSGLPAHVDERRSRLVRAARPDRRDRALRPRPRDQVRDLRDRADQGRDHRRAALARLGAALGALARARDRARDRRARAQARTARRPTRRSRRRSGSPTDELEESLTEISRSSIAALDELWSSRRAATRSP